MRETRRRGLSFRFERERKKDRISIAKAAAASNHLGWQGGDVIAVLKEKLFLLIFF